MKVCRENIAFFQALASEPRLHIIELLTGRQMNLRELADELEMSVTIVSRHVKALENAGIVRCVNTPSARGLQKLCSLAMRGSQLEFTPLEAARNQQIYDIPVGQYVEWSANRTCGMSTESHIIGEVDDPRYFADPQHIEAKIIWLTNGYLGYAIPNYMMSRQKVASIRFQLELCSEAPGYNEDWPSDIRFWINGHDVGYWTSPADFGLRKGLYTPEWWGGGTQHGMLKTLLVDSNGSFIDGNPISETTIRELDLCYGKPISFRVGALAEEANPGGLTIFGKSFGNYDMDIRVLVEYED